MARRNGGLTKSQMNNFAKLMAGFGVELEEEKVQEVAKEALYNAEQLAYEAQAVYNFFTARIQPALTKATGETEAAFTARQDKAYQEWRFKVCEGCNERFAYAYHYDGVKFCSLECLETALGRVGIQFSRHKDLRRRWGVRYPAIVPSSALQALERDYAATNPDAFVDAH